MKKLTKIFALMMALVMCVALVACGGKTAENKDSELAKITENGKMVIGYTIYEPMNYEENGKLTGFDTEFAEAVCEKLGVEPEFVEINWDTKFVTLDSNKIDCIWNGMTISDEVKQNCDVSDAYVKNAQVVVMKEDALESYKDVESLKGLKFAAEAGSAGETAIKDNGLDEKYSPVAAQTDALLAVIGGQADACVIDITMAKAMTADGTSYDGLGYSLELTTEEYGIGFRKGSDLAAKVNEIIAELNADGTLPALAEKYELNLAF
ncbi:MAG: transporter substrate-binding domain-containing protein [Clostridia bacterium]|nr:transporter substrate-binding domain-containing protein [Oscillospiraceae bacterium]MBQ7959963.1 transporter substrate-binding domain-containing protein [Clostridia bacterium]